MKKNLTVFLCSTYADLVDERTAIIDAINRLKLQHDSMEFFGARPNQPLETCLEEVRRSDILVVVVGHRYGSFIPDGDLSYSEAEYREGQRIGKPCLVYLRDENVPVLPKHVERHPEGLRALEKFKSLLRQRHTVAQFSNAHDISLQVTADLVRTIEAIEAAERAEKERHREEAGGAIEKVRILWDRAVTLGISEDHLLSSVRQAISTLLASLKRRPPIVFLSYSQVDKSIVRAFSDGLRKQGIEVWFDEERLTAGASFVDEISRGLDSADFLAFFVSRDSTQSKWANQELNVMMARRISSSGGAVILPILLDDAPVPALLRDVKYLDLRDKDTERGVRQLVEAISAHQARLGT